MFLFVVMMLDIDFAALRKGIWKHVPVGGFVGLVLAAELAWIFSSWSMEAGASARAAHPTPDASVMTNTHALGQVLYTHYVYLFQVAGIILLVAMVGAIALTLRHRSGTLHQSVSKQVNRKAGDVLKIIKVKTGAGVS